MSMWAVDTSVLLAILKGEARGASWLECLQVNAQTGALIASSLVVAEVRAFFPSERACRAALHDLQVRHSPLTEESAHSAGETFRLYRAQGGPRTTILPDFLVASHAIHQAGALATTDRGYLRRYFPALRLVAPGETPD